MIEIQEWVPIAHGSIGLELFTALEQWKISRHRAPVAVSGNGLCDNGTLPNINTTSKNIRKSDMFLTCKILNSSNEYYAKFNWVNKYFAEHVKEFGYKLFT